MVWNWPQHFERSKSHVQHGIWTAKTMTPWLSPYFDPEIVRRMVQHWFIKELLRILALKNMKKKSSSDQNKRRSSVVEKKIQEVFVSPLQSLEYDSIPKSLAAQLLGSIRKKKAMEFWGFVWFFWVSDGGLNILKMWKHLLIFFRYASVFLGGNPCPCSEIPE